MINIEDLLGKVANNGATLQGILAHGEWNTLVQAVREIQGIVVSDNTINDFKENIKEIQKQLQILIENGLLVPGSMEFDSTATSVTLKYKQRNSDGTDTPYAVTVPLVTSEKAGMMSAEDKELLTNAGKNIAIITESLKKEIDTRITADEKHDSDIAELQKEIWPLEVSLSVSPSVIEVNAQTSVRLSWSVKRKGVAVTPESQRLDGEDVTGTLKMMNLLLVEEGTRNFTYEATYEKMTKSVEAGVKAVYGSYFGVVPADWEPSAEKVALLTKSIQASRSMRKDGLKFGYSKICYCYPASFGLLTSIKDGNGYEVIDSYTRTALEIGGVGYLCYVLTNAVSVDNVTQIFS